MSSRRHWSDRVRDILDAMNLIVIGEAAAAIPEEVQEAHTALKVDGARILQSHSGTPYSSCCHSPGDNVPVVVGQSVPVMVGQSVPGC